MNDDKNILKYNKVRVLVGEYKGQEFDVESINITEGEVTTTGGLLYGLQQVAFLTPLTFNEEQYIAIGDELLKYNDDDWDTVYDFHWYDGMWHLLTVMNNDYENKCFIVNINNNIKIHLPIGFVSDEKSEWIKKGEQEEWIQDGGIVNQQTDE